MRNRFFYRPGEERTFRESFSSTVKLERKKFNANVVDIEQNNDRQVKAWFQKEDPSSSEKRTPPIGAPNAADTPAAEPAETNSRFSLGA